ncbi:hypothetical protein SEUCBS139899_006954 [Sporothrix eucalyptigena]|uniref:Uncharacterized protein n=1 Tax=Sporothrix eucalyptigena TaxID=1812306 RepID=A0ABP0C3S7_9PEZI
MTGSDTDKAPTGTAAAYRVATEHCANAVDEKVLADESLAGVAAAERAARDAEILNEFSPQEQRCIIRYIDRRLVVTIGFMYCVSLIDLTNLGYANIAGMSADLGLDVGTRYFIITLVFFVPYVFFQAPLTVMAGLRVVLGIFEAGFFLSCVYLLKLPPFRVGAYFKCATDWKLWAYGMMFFNTTTITYALAYFLPIILVSNMGFSVVEAQCLVAPPYAFAGIVMFISSWIGDKYRIRRPIVIFNNMLCIIGLPIVGFHPKASVRYFAVFLLTAGANSNIPAVMSYMANNIRGQWKRAFASALFVAFGGLGGICGSVVFRSQDSPTYHPGICACITVNPLSLILVGMLSLSFYRSHKKADRGEIELEAGDDDYQPGFRYTY